MDKMIVISKLVDLGKLDAEIKTKSTKVTGLSLNADTELIVYGADDLTNADILATVDAHVKPVQIDPRQKFKADVDASNQITPEVKALLKQLVDIR